MKEVIHLERIRMSCDVCGYRSEPVELNDSLIGTKCPDCTAVMVTKEGHEKAKQLVELIKQANALFGDKFGQEPTEAVREAAQGYVAKVDRDNVTVTKLPSTKRPSPQRH